jgi:histidine triad (HIT) family protein
MSVNGLPPYDEGNIFARILRGEIPARKVLETEHALAFHDISPQAPVHVLVIPKGAFVSVADFSEKAEPEVVAAFWRAVAETARKLGLQDGGFRVLTNMGHHAGQEVPHFHVHVFGGAPLGPMLARERD